MSSFNSVIDEDTIKSSIKTSNQITVLILSGKCDVYDQIRNSIIQSTSQITNYSFISLNSNDEDMLELAMTYNMVHLPSVSFYRSGELLLYVKDPTELSGSGISRIIEKLDRLLAFDVRKMVSESYASTLSGSQSCCVSNVDSTLMGYTAEQLATAGSANLGLGCGNPLSFADIKAGETVVDLGSGAGVDCFIAGAQVGELGHVIGIDMTPEMLHRYISLSIPFILSIFFLSSFFSMHIHIYTYV